MNRLLNVVLLDESSPSVYLAYEKPATECAMADGLKPFDAWTPEKTSKIRQPLFDPRIMDHVGCKHFKVKNSTGQESGDPAGNHGAIAQLGQQVCWQCLSKH